MSVTSTRTSPTPRSTKSPGTMKPLATRSDAELVALLRAGEMNALAEINRRYRSLMLSVARPLVAGTGHDAEDAVQDALIRAARSLSGNARDVELRPWLAVVVRNRALDLRRRRANAVSALPEDLPSRSSDPADAVVRRDDVLRAMRALSALPVRQRTVLAARTFEGASHGELARRLGATVPAVKSLLLRARQAIAAAT